ncbi:MAG TPA: VCBS repeat-containing protein [Polyangia bacterium]|nr:VCBS repeat-containing protein [Polyangia bacterium]
MALFGVVAAGCGGSGGATDGKTDADARVDGADTGDASADRGDTADLPIDRVDAAETADVPVDHGDTSEAGDVLADHSETGEAGDGLTDALPPAGVAALTIGTQTSKQRRQSSFPLTWTAPDDQGRSVAGYRVRVAKVAIDSTNFDQTAANQSNPLLVVTKDIPYTGTPAAPGMPDGIVVPDLNIELGYFFAVAAVDAAGNRGPIVTTSAAQSASFIPNVLTGPGAGFTVDAGDFGSSNGTFAKDGLSDLLVGSRGGDSVWIYFGTTAGYSLAHSTTITIGGRAVSTLTMVNAGDVDGDALDDIAVSSSVTGAASGDTIWIFSRKNPSFVVGWPSTLTEANANYTITVQGASLFSGKLSQRPLSRLGNFDAAGADDLAIGFSGYVGPAGQKGSVLIVKGSSSFPATLTIPETVPTSTIEIDGTSTNAFFGATLVGLGQFYAAPAGTTLLVGDTGNGTAYAFAGPMTTASQMVTDAAQTDYTRTVGLLGSMPGTPNGIAIASTLAGRIDLHLGAATAGPFNVTGGTTPAAKTSLIDTAASNSFGAVNLGGGIHGTAGSVSVIGDDATPDLIVGGLTEAGITNAGPLYIINGAAIPGLPAGNWDVSTINPTAPATGVIPTVVKVNNQIPPPGGVTWNGYASTCVLPDLNGDGIGDFAIGEAATAPAVGRIVVFY